MRCYFWGTSNLSDRAQRGRGIISFAIPDWGVQFRAAHVGTATECEYAALLSLLRFIETNPKAFEDRKLAIGTDAVSLIYQLSGKAPVNPAEAKLRELVGAVRKRIPFELIWVPSAQNPAINGVLDLAPLQLKNPIRYTHLDRKKSSDKQSPGNPLL